MMAKLLILAGLRLKAILKIWRNYFGFTLD